MLACFYERTTVRAELIQIIPKKYKKHLTSAILCGIVYLVAEENTFSRNICDSGVVGNARPCQGRDRGFEPRLSLLQTRTIRPGFLYFRTFPEQRMHDGRTRKKPSPYRDVHALYREGFFFVTENTLQNKSAIHEINDGTDGFL